MADDAAWNAGWALGERIQGQRQEHKQALSDMELQGKITDLVENRKAIQAKLPTLLDDKGQPTPEYQQAMDSLTQNARDLREVYHPQRNPTAIAKYGHLLTDALHVTNPAQRQEKQASKQASLAAGDQRTAQSLAAAAPLSPEQTAVTTANANAAGDLASVQAKIKNLNTLFPNATPEQKQTWFNELAQAITGGKTLAEKYFSQIITTKDTEGKEHHWRVPMDSNMDPEEIDFNGQVVVPKTPPKVNKMTTGQLLQDSYLASLKLPSSTPWESLTDAQRTGYQLYVNKLKQRASNHQSAITDREGNVHIVDLSGSSGPVEVSPSPTRPSATPPPAPHGGAGTATPKATGSQKSGGSSSKGDRVLDFQKSTPSYTKAKNDVVDATKLDSIATQVAAHPDDAVNQKRLAVQLERASAGRFTVQALDYIIKAGWGNTIEGWALSPTTGALPPDIVRQLVEGAHENLKAAKDSLQVAITPIGSDSVATQPPSGARPQGAIGKWLHKGKYYWVDKDGNNLGAAQ
jgi:hypothetical protein